MKIIVVGAGIAGSAFARIARDEGHEAVVVAERGLPHSVAATAVLRRAYHRGDPSQLTAFDYALGQYKLWDIPLTQGGLYSSRRLPEEREDADWYLIDPVAPLIEPDVREQVVSVMGPRAWLGPGRYMMGDAVVLAVGATGPLAPTGKITWGITWQHSGPAALTLPQQLRVHQYAPYRTMMAGVVGGYARLGSSSAVKQETAIKQADSMMRMAWDLGWLTTARGWEALLGARVQTAGNWWREPEGHWRLTGFHRTGYALAPGAARELLDAIEMSA